MEYKQVEIKYKESKRLMAECIKTIPARHYLARELRNLHGAEGYGYLTMLLDLAQDIGPYELTIAILKRECELKAQKAERLFPDLKRIFEESLVILGLSSKNPERILKESFNNPEVIFEESLNNLERLEGQNPRGSINACAGEDNIFINNINNKKINKKNSPDEILFEQDFQTWYSQYPKKSARGHALKAYLTARKKVSAEVLLSGLEQYKQNKPSYADWKNPATWLNGLCWEDEYTPKPENNVTPITIKSDFEKLKEFPFIGDSASGEWFTIDQLSPHPEIGNAYVDPGGGLHYIGSLKGLTEVPANVGA